jgi:hypothetical protein
VAVHCYFLEVEQAAALFANGVAVAPHLEPGMFLALRRAVERAPDAGGEFAQLRSTQLGRNESS